MAAGGETQRKKSESSTHASDIVDDDVDDEMPDFDDPDDFIDPISDRELLKDLLIDQPKAAIGFDSVILVDNLPQVGPEKLEKLKTVITRNLKPFSIKNDYYPKTSDNVTKGYAFLEMGSSEEATQVVKRSNGLKLDKTHILAFNLFSDFEKYLNMSDDWQPPKHQPYIDHGNLYDWLLDADCRDQYCVLSDGGEKLGVYQNSQNGVPKLLVERNNWTESYVEWSARGKYLATMHGPGAITWGSSNFEKIVRMKHDNVQLIQFSPCELFLVTFSTPASPGDPRSICIWDTVNGHLKRFFPYDASHPQWPIIRWSHDDKYFARLSKDTISVYESSTFGMLDKKSIKVTNVQDISWSPTDNYIAYWVPEVGQVTARIEIINIPSRERLSTKNLFNVVECRLVWQKAGDYLVAKVDRYTKIKVINNETKYIGLKYSFEIFRLREKLVPVDVIEVTDTVIAFAWEPVGHRFAYMYSDGVKNTLCFQQIRPGGKLDMLRVLEKKNNCNHLFWAPTGQFLVLAGLKTNSTNGVLEFYDVQENVTMAHGEHFMATNVEWDPTGRYVCTYVSWYAHKVDNGFYMWTFQGRLLFKQPVPQLCSFFWRPRPPSLLPPEAEKEIKKTMKNYSVEFEKQDRSMLKQISKELLEKRQKLMAEYEEFLKEVALDESVLEERKSLRPNLEDDKVDYEEEVIEFLINVQEVKEEISVSPKQSVGE